MDAKQVATEFTNLCKEGKFEESGKRFWADNVVSIEAMDGPMAKCTGLAEVKAKSEWWYANHTVHEVKVEGPYGNGDQFIVRFIMDVTPKDGQRMKADEMGVYTVKNGKVVEEKFFYGA